MWKVYFDLTGNVFVEGRTPEEAADLLRQRLQAALSTISLSVNATIKVIANKPGNPAEGGEK